MNNETYISIRNVSKSFGAVKAVINANIDIAKGEFFGLLGSSGCGKTTLLRMLAGFGDPTSGQIYLEGQPMTGVPPHKRQVNMVFQSYAIFPHLNVHQNIAYGLRKERLSKKDLNARVDETLELIRLEGFGDRRASEMSGGQRQRVALARALIMRPKVLLLDEPLGALDKNLREQMQIELRQLQRSLGITFVFVTHDQEEALAMSDRVAVMSGGEILEIGSPGDLYERPRSRFVAEFLGTMNFFSGVVLDSKSGSDMVDVKGLGQVTVKDGREKVEKGSSIMVGIRPENFRIKSAGDAASPGCVPGTITNMTYLGDRAHIHVRIDDCETPVLVAMQNYAGVVSSSANPGQKIFLDWSKGAMLRFADHEADLPVSGSGS